MRELIIKTNLKTGKMEVSMEGVQGTSCVELLQKIHVGEVKSEEHTDDYYKGGDLSALISGNQE